MPGAIFQALGALLATTAIVLFSLIVVMLIVLSIALVIAAIRQAKTKPLAKRPNTYVMRISGQASRNPKKNRIQ